MATPYPHAGARGATFTPSPVLHPATPSSYPIAVGDAEQVAAHLVARGWRRLPGNTEHEIARMRDNRRGLVVLYRSTALVQGQAEQGHRALAELVEEGGAR